MLSVISVILHFQATPDQRKNLEDLQAENALLKEDISRLQKRLEHLEQEHREHVEVLEFQVKAHRDDWEAERGEKQQALRDKAAMELQVKELQKDARSLKHKVLWPVSVLSCFCGLCSAIS
jgi:dynactin complex subunit